MASARAPEPVLPVASVFSAFPAAIAEARTALIARLGPLLLELGPFAFTETDYYAPTMGPQLHRCLFAFSTLADLGFLPEIKRWTNEVEDSFRGRPEFPAERPVNIDPGYVASGKLVLASLKDFSHRLYLGQGVYGEVTLWWRGGKWETSSWTYPDYATERFRTFFVETRTKLLEKLRARTTT